MELGRRELDGELEGVERGGGAGTRLGGPHDGVAAPQHRTLEHEVVGQTERLDQQRAVVDHPRRVVGPVRRVRPDRAVASEEVAHLERGADVGAHARGKA